ncbi:DNA-binding protein H-NS [Paraburkholderia sp. GAS199]|uniref:H-NS histone family protein n=1 Tax=Paraburkholderia sp. GAS199 TaxID=3035126 RepID=UPI003D206C0F
MPTLEQIQAKLKKLQAQADVLIARKAQVAVDQIRDLMLKHGLTTEDIEAKARARRAAQGLNGSTSVRKTKALSAGGKVAKYRDAKTGATWTGHGRAPAWIASVKDRTQFLVDGASEMKSAAKALVKSAKAGKKGQPKGAQPPKYRDPKSGATWSGRGPAPAWLASAKDRTRFLIDGAAAVASAAAPKAASKASVKAAKVKTAAKKVAKKVTAKKSATVKAAVKKVAAKKSLAKPSAKKTAAKKVTAKKAAVKSAAVKKTAVKKAAVKKTVAKKAPVRKTAPKVSTVATTAAAVPETSAASTSA